MPKDYTVARRIAIELGSKGEVANCIEVTPLAGVSRQLVRQSWLRGIDLQGKRQTHLRKLWRQHLKAQRSRQ